MANNLYSLLETAAARWPERVFVEFLGREYTYADMAAMADEVARCLKAHGLQPRDRVALCLPNCPYYVAFFYGVLKAGGVLVNINPLYTPAEIAAQLADSGSRVVVTVDVPMMTDKLLEVRKTSPELGVVVCSLGGCMPRLQGWLYGLFKAAKVAFGGGVMHHRDFLLPPGENLIFAKLKTPAKAVDMPEDLALLQYTGGTTGTPKGAMLTHANLLANTAQCVDRLSSDKPERIMGVLPLFHVFALTSSLLMGAALGAVLILLPRFTPASLLKKIKASRPTLLPGVPALFDALIALPEMRKSDFDGIACAVSGGAPLPPAVKQRFEAATGVILREGYGLTEASPVVACTLTTRQKPGSVGPAMKETLIEIRDAEGKALANGETGEIWAKGAQVMAGYWNNPAETALVLKKGWLFTGDLGHLDAEGWLFVTDRQKDLIIVNGYKVYPRVVEEVLQAHPAVAEVLVAGIAHPQKGEVPKAFIRVQEGATVTAAEITAYAAAHLNPMERPAEVEFRDSLPKTFIGKPSRKLLKT